MITDERFNELVDLAREIALEAPEGSYLGVFTTVLKHSIENEQTLMTLPLAAPAESLRRGVAMNAFMSVVGGVSGYLQLQKSDPAFLKLLAWTFDVNLEAEVPTGAV